ncbi:DUF309 domain-containing protein [Rhodococcus rhodnii]|uniref:DUF309 domain-containing protein n=2 Tax=Rhodococcus rhodnii TaxID=38312 RepID=R7WSM0_9NOCA|nr:DUF309 domain-containing protein [Rhodococcus rhodnii]EOM77019.1 hypothetical protein Rrhod_1638 [Rhodococcus rhodnii LMG 5362]TXG89905.1 DUF309 domain-containing protein [Rhodococcus rhodnii]
MPDRDRDDDGRPRNARPRDGLGRPLPHGTPGVEPMPEDLELDPDEAVTEGQRLLDHERPFHAHEVFESVWKAASPEERDLWQGLAQLAVGVTHIARGNVTGARTVLARAHSRIRLYENDPPYGLDIAGLTTWLEHVEYEIDADRLQTPLPVPRLRLP